MSIVSNLAEGSEASGRFGGLYGSPPAALIEPPAGAVQLSPTQPGAAALEGLQPGSMPSMIVHAPPGAVERRYVLAASLRAMRRGAGLVALAAKDLGGSRLRKELEAFGCTVEEDARRHFRICRVERPAAPLGLEPAIAAGAPQIAPALGLWSQPGIFSWDRVDPGSALLARSLPGLAGQGGDLGCGVGYLALKVLESPSVAGLDLIDIDRRAVEAAGRNVIDPRARRHWADVRSHGLSGLDFVVMNPPFHRDGTQDHSLGQAFIQRAALALRKGGVLWLVANRHLPYEALLKQLFAGFEIRADTGGYKVIEARK